MTAAPDRANPHSAPTDPGHDLDAAALVRLRRQAAGLAKLLGLSHALAASGRAVDLRGLDQEIGRLCAGALDLPPALGRRLRADLQALLPAHEALTALFAARAGPPPD